jgi:hypothetical protein
MFQILEYLAGNPLMRKRRHPLPIVGDVDTATEVSVNTKGGSLSTTLKKGIRESLGEVGYGLTAAALRFDTGEGVVLLSGAPESEAPASVRVSRIGSNRFEVELDSGEGEEIDDLTAAFLTLKIDQFKKGRLHLTGPVDADEWKAEMDEKFRKAAAETKRTARRTP